MDQHVDRRFLLGGLTGAAGIAALAHLAKAGGGGPLNPPFGTVTPTGKPIGELEPRVAVNQGNTPGVPFTNFRLVQPGSYYLTADLNVPASYTGIEMAAGTTLDLNGFTISGLASSALGIRLNAGCTVRNGTIANCGNAMTVGVSPGAACLVEDVTVTGFSGRGIDLGGGSVVRRCRVSGTGITGIELQGDYGVVDECIASTTVSGGGGRSTSTPTAWRATATPAAARSASGWASARWRRGVRWPARTTRASRRGRGRRCATAR